ncbi:hypothetical protein [Sulfitobacter sp.]|uniref:hypothetical protein n=1 Tax=Sulfitobacter sp. TaxID=1903071 RepID=UPI00300261AB
MDKITNLIDALIESGNRFAAECGANPGAEFEKIAASYETIIVDPEFPTLRKALDHRHCAQNLRHPLTMRCEMAQICYAEMLEIADVEGWSFERLMQFSYLRACLVMCATIGSGQEAGYIEVVLKDLKRRSRMSGGSWSVNLAPLHEDAEAVAVPMFETSGVFGETFEQGANTHFTEMASARDGDLTGILLQHSFFADRRKPGIHLIAPIRSEAGAQRFKPMFAIDDLQLQAMAVILVTKTPAMKVLDLLQLRGHHGEIYSLHFKDFGIVIVDQDDWCELNEDVPNTVPPVTLLGKGGTTMTTARIRAIQAGIATLQHRPNLSWIQSLDYKPFGPV